MVESDPVTLRRASAVDHAPVREVRLRALLEDPDAFGSTHAREKDRQPEEWAAWVARPDAATFLALHAGRPVGLATGSPYRQPSHKVGLFGMWVAPELRGQGVGGRLVDAVVTWALEAGHRRLHLDVGDANGAAVRLYASRGFVPTGAKGVVDADRPHIAEHERVLDLATRATAPGAFGAAAPLDAWDWFLAERRPDIGYMQARWWADLLSLRGWSHFDVLIGPGEGEILGGARVLVKSFTSGLCHYDIPQGPVLPSDPDEAREVFAALLDALDDQRRASPETVSHVRIEPRWTERPPFLEGFRESRRWKEPRRTLCVDLHATDEELLGQMKRMGRYNVRLAGRKGVRVVEDVSVRGFEDFVRLYRATHQRHGLKGRSADHLEGLRRLTLPQQRGSLLFAEHAGERLACAWLLLHGDTATYKYGGSATEHRGVMAPYLLHYEAMRLARSRGHRWYDFYGVSPPDRPDHRWAAFSAFKRKLGGHELCFVPALEHVYDEAAWNTWRARR